VNYVEFKMHCATMKKYLRVFWFSYVKNISSVTLTHTSTISPLYFPFLEFDSVVK